MASLQVIEQAKRKVDKQQAKVKTITMRSQKRCCFAHHVLPTQCIACIRHSDAPCVLHTCCLAITCRDADLALHAHAHSIDCHAAFLR